jgi:hypothetical protein
MIVNVLKEWFKIRVGIRSNLIVRRNASMDCNPEHVFVFVKRQVQHEFVCRGQSFLVLMKGDREPKVPRASIDQAQRFRDRVRSARVRLLIIRYKSPMSLRYTEVFDQPVDQVLREFKALGLKRVERKKVDPSGPGIVLAQVVVPGHDSPYMRSFAKYSSSAAGQQTGKTRPGRCIIHNRKHKRRKPAP